MSGAKTLAIAGTNLRRLVRERANVFFLFLLPMLIILLLGVTFGRRDARVGVVVERTQLELASGLVDALERTDDLEVVRYAKVDDLSDAVERGRAQAGLVVPAAYDATLRSGGVARVDWLARPDAVAQQLRVTVESAVAAQAALVRAARLAIAEAGGDFEERLAQARAVSASVPGVRVETVAAGEALFPEDLGRFDRSASSQLLLFVFLTSLTAATSLIEVRRLGLSRRMLATPTSARAVVAGEALGRIAVALAQAFLIMGGATLVFGVDWGAPVAAIVLVSVFCLVGAGFGMLLGSALSNEQQAGALAFVLGLGLAALGGCMVPLEVFPDTVRHVAQLTPHAWANDAFTELVGDGGGLADIWGELAVLAGFAAAAFSAALLAFRRSVLG